MVWSLNENVHENPKAPINLWMLIHFTHIKILEMSLVLQFRHQSSQLFQNLSTYLYLNPLCIQTRDISMKVDSSHFHLMHCLLEVLENTLNLKIFSAINIKASQGYVYNLLTQFPQRLVDCKVTEDCLSSSQCMAQKMTKLCRV